MHSITISSAGVAKLLSDIKPFKASGPDDILAYLLKEIAFQIAPSLAMVVQASLNQCKLAADWKVAHVVPVFEKGDKSLPHNYRPISFTCLCCKILEHIVYSKIFMHLNQANILCEEQHGFRERRCCESQLILTIDDFAQCLNVTGYWKTDHNVTLGQLHFIDPANSHTHALSMHYPCTDALLG